MKWVFLIQIALLGILGIAAGVWSQENTEYSHSMDTSLQEQIAAATNEVEHSEHHGRSKRSPADPVLASLLIAKSFILGGLLGSTLGRHHGHGGGWRRVQRSHIIPNYGGGWHSGPSHSYGYSGGHGGGWGTY